MTVIAKFFLFCVAMILSVFCIYRANHQVPQGLVAGWSIHTNRDTKIYVQPNNVTTIHEPKDVCPKSNRDKKNELFLLIIVYSSTTHFDQRKAVRETWGDYVTYFEMSKLFISFATKEEKENLRSGNITLDFKLVFLLGLPAHANDTTIQGKIEEEVEKYGDVIQEGFIDSYTNLTLKSIMMLKWITNKCNESVRYILKTDDDMYINVRNLVSNLCNRSREHDEKVAKESKQDEYLLIGHLSCDERPSLDSSKTYYSPRYMYNERVYPCFLRGAGYVLSAPTARALYKAALTTHYFHLEDVYIGMCALRANPRIVLRHDPGFMCQVPEGYNNVVHAHLVSSTEMRILHQRLLTEDFADRLKMALQIPNSAVRLGPTGLRFEMLFRQIKKLWNLL